MGTDPILYCYCFRINHSPHLSLAKKFNFMDDCPAKLKIIPDHFQIPTTSTIESTSTTQQPGTTDHSLRYSLLVKKGT